MPDEPGRLGRIEGKIDQLIRDTTHYRERVERRLTVLETARRDGVRWTGILWGFGGGLMGAFLTAWLGKHL